VKVISSAQQGFEKDDFNSYKDLNDEVYFLGEYTNLKSNRFSKNLMSLKKLIIHLPRPVNRFIHLIKFLIFGENRNWLNAVKSEYRDILDKWKPDIIFSSQSPISSHKAASFISGEIDVKWIAEFRDSWSFNPMAFSNSENDLSSVVLRLIERRILTNCSLILAATNFIKFYYDKHYKIDTYLLLGGWDAVTSMPTINSKAKKKLKITHLGSMLYGRRSITPIINILNNNKKISTRYEFNFIGRHTSFFKNELSGTKAEKSLTLKEHLPYSDAESYGYAADLLLILMMDTPQEKYTLTGKIFDYIKYHKPIIIVDPYESEASKLIKNFNMGHVLRNFIELEDFLESCESIQSFKRISDEDREKFKRTSQITSLIRYLKLNLNI